MNQTKSVVLLVEDDPLTLIHSTLALEDAGYEVVTAADGEEALVHIASRNDIGALFTDIGLPGRVDGVDVAAAVRRAYPAAAIVVTSGRDAPAKGVMPAGGRFMAKPYTAAQLRRMLGNC